MKKVYAHEESADLRELEGGGGWFRIENELQVFFLRLVGYKACWLYGVMCRLVPLAQRRLAEGTRLELTDRFCAENTGISKSQVQREMKTLVAIGMIRRIEKSKNRPPTYQLVNLRELAALGHEVLLARLGDPQRATAEESEDDAPDVSTPAKDAEGRAGRADSPTSTLETLPHTVAAPATLPAVGDPQRATSEEEVQTSDSAPEIVYSGPPVAQEMGVGGPGEGVLIKERERRQKNNNTPLPPSEARGVQGASGISASQASQDDLVRVRAAWNGVVDELHAGFLADTRGPETRPGWLRDGLQEFEKYFAPIGFEGVRGKGAELTLILAAPQPRVAEYGISQYRKRISLAMNKFFGRDVHVDFRRTPVSAEAPKRPSAAEDDS
jgi:hypothetical protein